MNRIIYLLSLCLIGLAGCSKDDIPAYDVQGDGIQFNYNKGQFESEIDFAFQYEEIPDEWGYPMPSYYGDALQEQRVKLAVSLLGRPADKDRTFKLKAVTREGLQPDLAVLADHYIFRAGKEMDTIELTIKRPAIRGTYTIELTFDTQYPATDFTEGAVEKLLYSFTIKDRYPKPEDWDGRMAWLGEYSEEKYAFIVTELHQVYGYYVDWGMYNQQLRDALDRYNKANPDNSKTFTFPINTDSIWW